MLAGWWFTDLWQQSPVWLVSWIAWVVGSIVLHELAHGWAAIRLGDRTPIETGHMTWSPMVHMGPVSLVCLLLGGFCWGAMPVDPGRLRGRHGDAIVALAGPAMNVALAMATAILCALWMVYGSGVGPDHFNTNLRTFLWCGVSVNMIGAMFNMLPIPPLDGSRIVGSVVPAYRRFFSQEMGAVVALVAFALLMGNVFGGSICKSAGELGMWQVRLWAGLFSGGRVGAG